MFALSKTFRHRVLVIAAVAVLSVTAALPQQSALAGPVAPPPGKSAAKSCVKNGKLGVKTPKGCVVKLGPVAPPPGM